MVKSDLDLQGLGQGHQSFQIWRKKGGCSPPHHKPFNARTSPLRTECSKGLSKPDWFLVKIESSVHEKIANLFWGQMPTSEIIL